MMWLWTLGPPPSLRKKEKKKKNWPGGHGPAGETEPLVVSSVDVPHQLVHPGAVAQRGHLQSFFKGGAARQQAAQAEEGPPTQAAQQQHMAWREVKSLFPAWKQWKQNKTKLTKYQQW